LWGNNDNAQVKERLERNRKLLDSYVAAANRQVREFNEGLQSVVKAAFSTKVDELTSQHAIFGGLGMTEEKEPDYVLPNAVGAPHRKATQRGNTYIIQYVENQYVEQLNQTNNNVGDVNNAIQSNQ